MKILISVDPEIPVPPPLYGGIERLVDGLINEYTKQGHEVILLAHPESTQPNAARKYAWPALFSRGYGNVWKNAWTLYRVVKTENPDIIHSFCRLLYLYPSVILRRKRVIMTYERFISPHSTALASVLMGKRIRFTAAASHMLSHLKKFRKKFSPVFNFVPVDSFLPDPDVEKEYLMFLGRIENIKGTRECIDVAIQTGYKLIIAGNIQPGHEDWYEDNVKPFLDHPLIEYVGPVNDEQKLHYLQRSKALLFPIKWEEPFGIVMVEAMACGTPVVAFRRGSVPEIVESNKNGYIVNTVEEMVKAVANIDAISRIEVRNDCVSRFSQEVVAAQYLKLFEMHLERS